MEKVENHLVESNSFPLPVTNIGQWNTIREKAFKYSKYYSFRNNHNVDTEQVFHPNLATVLSQSC